MINNSNLLDIMLLRSEAGAFMFINFEMLATMKIFVKKLFLLSIYYHFYFFFFQPFPQV